MENTDNKTCIERIEIKGLRGRCDVNWALHSDVNILVGENGTGKSTILRIIKNLMKVGNNTIASGVITHSDTVESFNLFTKSNLCFPDNETIEGNYIHDEGKQGHVSVKRDGIFRPNFDYINTFESQLLDRGVIEKIANNDVKTSLDFSLYNLEQRYWKYQIELYERIVDQNLDKDKVNANHRLFIEKVNRFFSVTGKTFAQRRDTKAIVFNEKETELSLYQLSSGEKQLLVILLTVLMQDQKPFVLLMDEPEISLHLRWQDELIEVIRELNPNCQVIIVTHSPSLFSDGWNDRIFWMEDICKPIQKLETV